MGTSFGYAQRPADTALWLDQRLDLLTYLNLLPQPRQWNAWLSSEAPVKATYRESLEPMVANPDGGVTAANPPVTQPGMTEFELDAQGRLRGFLGAPTRAATGAPAPVDAVFKAAQLDTGRFVEVTPVTIPPVPTDRLQAWEGPHPAIPGLRMHLETGWWQGRVTYVKFRWPWTKDTGPAQFNAWISEIQEVLLPLVTAIVLTFAILFARRNWRQGRGDRKGAFVVGMAMFTLNLLNWAASVHAVPSASMTGMLFEALASSTFRGAMFLLMYLALEPALRARWPHSIITWNRVLAGRWNDAQVASDILIGTMVGALILVAVMIHDASLASRYGLDTLGGLYLLNGPRYWITGMFGRVSEGVTTGIAIFFVLFGLRTILRRDWIAAIVGALILATLEGDLANAINWQVEFAVYAVVFAVLVFAMLRLGLVVTVVSIFTINLMNGITLGTDLTAWYAPTGFATMIVTIAITLWSFRRTLGDRELV